MLTELTSFIPESFRNPVILLGLLSGLLLGACDKKNNTATLSPETIDSLKREMLALNDSSQATWNDMLAADAQKLRHIDTLLLRIRQSGPSDLVLLERVTSLRTSLEGKRYTKPDGLTSTQIDTYDAATDSLVTGVKMLYQGIKQPQRCENCEELISRIEQLDEKVLPYRMEYDRQTDAYNSFIHQNGKALKQADEKFDSTRRKPLFRLQS